MAKVAKIIEVVGSSDKGWSEAASTAVKVAGKTIKNISGIEVQDMTASVKNGKIATYKTTIRVAFAVND